MVGHQHRHLRSKAAMSVRKKVEVVHAHHHLLSLQCLPLLVSISSIVLKSSLNDLVAHTTCWEMLNKGPRGLRG